MARGRRNNALYQEIVLLNEHRFSVPLVVEPIGLFLCSCDRVSSTVARMECPTFRGSRSQSKKGGIIQSDFGGDDERVSAKWS
jgi:hypothetical protein